MAKESLDLVQQARHLADQGHYFEAAEILAQHARSAKDYLSLGLCYESLGLDAKALKAYRKAQQLQPTLFSAFLHEALLLAKTHPQALPKKLQHLHKMLQQKQNSLILPEGFSLPQLLKLLAQLTSPHSCLDHLQNEEE